MLPVPALDGPRLDALSGRARSLVVLLHGYGASGDELIALGAEWRHRLPDTAFSAPHAPEPFVMAGFEGRQWFALATRDSDECWRGVQLAEPSLAAFIASELRRLDLAPDRLALVGFSQGMMVALHVGLRLDRPPAAILGYSGMLAGVEHLPRGAGGAPSILLIHGEADDVIPVAALGNARDALARQGYDVQTLSRPGLGHGIDEQSLEAGGQFLARALAPP